MDRNDFLDEVQRRGDLESTDEAERATRATLETLAERIIPDEATDLASQLPVELADSLRRTEGTAERFSLEEFVGRVARRGGVDEARGMRFAQAVFAATAETVSPREFSDVVSQLPNEYEPLLVLSGGMEGRHT